MNLNNMRPFSIWYWSCKTKIKIYLNETYGRNRCFDVGFIKFESAFKNEVTVSFDKFGVNVSYLLCDAAKLPQNEFKSLHFTSLLLLLCFSAFSLLIGLSLFDVVSLLLSNWFFWRISCCAFLERFHFILRFWNQILTCFFFLD